MSSQEVTTETVRKKLPSQPTVNIGTSGHVDHGKCLTPDQFCIIGSSLKRGDELISTLPTKGKILNLVDDGALYQIEDNIVLSLNEKFESVRTSALFYVQDYVGPVILVRSASGRKISVTPEHPLLVNRRGKIAWIKAKDLRPLDSIAFLSQIPALPAKVFPDPIEKLRKIYSVVTFEDYLRLSKITADFSNLSALNSIDLNIARIIGCLSKNSLSRLAGVDYNLLRRFLNNKTEPSEEQRIRIIEAIESSGKFHTLSAGEYLLETRSNRWNVVKIKESELDSDLVKWFAFVWSEGSSSQCRIAVAQTIQQQMLEEFLEITARKFDKSFKRVSRVDYHLNCKPLVDYLRFKFSFVPGSEDSCSISDWILSISADLRATFLRWFFTLDGEFNDHSGQIMLSQRNERNIVTIAYLLQMFNIVPRFSVSNVVTKRGAVKYHRLMVSGRDNLKLFAKCIGFEDSRIAAKLEKYLSTIKEESKGSNFSIAVDGQVLSSLLTISGVLREGFSSKNGETPAKKMSWYKAYEAALRYNRISRAKFIELLESVDVQLRRLEQTLNDVDADQKSILRLMKLARISQEDIAVHLGIRRKKFRQMLLRGEFTAAKRTLSQIVNEKLEDSLKIVTQLRRLVASPLTFDPIKSAEVKSYSGKIFDLSVPSYANFIAGNGAIVCHNTTLVQAITGIWTSAHSEELRRGITIKVGYADAAFYKCSGCPPPDCYRTEPNCEKCGGEPSLQRVISFVDCPGHESLMANMLSGAAVMDGSVLVIAANEKVPQPQTREHLLALQMMGTKNIVIVQNKVDLVSDKDAADNYKAIKNFVAGSVAANAPIIPISAQHKLNIDALLEAIETHIPTPKRDENAPPLMQVLRSFDVNHPGMDESRLVGGVLGGTLLQGKLSEGDEIELKPGIIEEGQTRSEQIVTRVYSLMTSAGRAKEVHPGGLIAIGTQLDPFFTRSDLLVGSVLGRPNELPPVFESLSLDVKLFETAVGTQDLVKVDKVKMSEILRLNVGTGVTVGIVSSSREAIVDCKLKKPVCAAKGSRVAISRRIGDRWRLIGSGTVR